MSGVSVDIAVPDDWHVHLRDDDLLHAVAPFTARWFRYALVMPNLVPPITTVEEAVRYRQRILDAVGPGAPESFQPLMTLYLTEGLRPDEVRWGFEQGVVAGVKYYPAGATTNSEHGGTSLLDVGPVLDALVELDVPLLVHAESTDPAVDVFDRERHFLDHQLAPVVAARPELRVTVEHVSTRAGVDFVTTHDSVCGSITPHHLACDRTDLLANGLRPDLYCKPIINSPDDREALVEAATSGSPSFFLGTDSAPHPQADKYAERAKAGIFNAPFALPVVAEVFHGRRRLDRLEGFASHHGCRAYGFEPSAERLRLTRRAPMDGEPIVDEVTTSGGDVVRIFGTAEARRWSLERLAPSAV
ncbi:MAG: dihydroorotase [Acidimicrobiales bacterium]